MAEEKKLIMVFAGYKHRHCQSLDNGVLILKVPKQQTTKFTSSEFHSFVQAVSY